MTSMKSVNRENLKTLAALGVCILAYFHISTFAHSSPAPYGRFEDGMLAKTRPAGWLAGA